MVDERLTSAVARQDLIDAGVAPRRLKSKVDKLAAQTILQAFLDAQRAAAGGVPVRVGQVVDPEAEQPGEEALALGRGHEAQHPAAVRQAKDCYRPPGLVSV